MTHNSLPSVLYKISRQQTGIRATLQVCGSVFAMVLFLLMQQEVHAQNTRKNASVTMNFVNAEVDGVARAISAIINRQIIVDPRVQGQITLYSEQPVTPNQAYLNFLSALRGQGFSLVEVAGLLKVVPEADAKLHSGTVQVGNSVKTAGDVILTQIFKLQFETANNLVTVLRPLISPNNTINVNAGTNSLVITDYADNLKRIGQIIAALDVPSTGDMQVIPLQYTVAADIAPLVSRLNAADNSSSGGAVTQQATLVIADTRTNSLLVKTTSTARLGAIKKLVAQIDRPSLAGVGGSGIHVVYLKNADAVKLAQILRAAFATGGGGSSAVSSSTASLSSAPSQTSTTNSSGSASGASTQSTAPVASSASPSTGGNIQADPATNSLIITAPEALYRQLRAVIDQLDGRRAQLFIEAMIVEVNADKFAQVGVQWQTILGQKGDSSIIGLGTNFPLSTLKSTVPSIVGSAQANSAAVAGAVRSVGFNIGVAKNFGDDQYGLVALASFLQNNADGNVLSSPNLVVLDNEEAKIVSGQNVPFLTGTSTQPSSSSTNPFVTNSTVERKDVGLTLRVKPQIGENGTIRMTVFQENSGVDRESTGDGGGLITGKSSIETSVVVDDGTLLILGGLIKDETSLSKNKVPILGDVPVLGRLFKSETRQRTRKNLMVFLRPVIMRTQDASNAVTSERYEYMRQQQQAIKPDVDPLLPIGGGKVLPPLSNVRSTIKSPASVQPRPVAKP